jgi:hypothetical protein
MVRKLFFISILSFSVVALSSLAEAASVIDLTNRIFDVDGSLKLTVNAPGMIKITATLPKLATFDEYFLFRADKTFEDQLLVLGLTDLGQTLQLPLWHQNGSNFTIDIAPVVDSLGNYLNSALKSFGVSVTSSKDPVFTGKIASNSKISGKLTINYDISVEAPSGSANVGTIIITMSFKGTPMLTGVVFSQERERIPKLDLSNLILEIMSLIPTGGAEPQE